MIIIGVDENGLGPLLGPLVVTAAAFRTTSDDPQSLWELRGDDLPADDSKKLFSKSRRKTAEAAFIKWLQLFGHSPTTYGALFDAVCENPGLDLANCQKKNVLCEPSRNILLPVWTTQQSTVISPALRNRIDATGITPLSLRAFSLCPGHFNARNNAKEMHKFLLDFELMLRLIQKTALEYPNEMVFAICGKIGSTRFYGPWFEFMGYGQLQVVAETRACSEYNVETLGRIQFVRDADSACLPVAVASMVGKYLRELAMLQLNRTLGAGLREASGYRDRVTADFVSQTSEQRRQLHIDDDCFLRRS